MHEHQAIIDQIFEVTGWTIKPHRFKLLTDTSDWLSIVRGHVIELEGKLFAIRGNMRETRFGISDQPKYWVFSAVDLQTGKEKIIKTVFYEEFVAHIGILKVHCYRSPDKEGKTLALVENDPRFMHGHTYYDSENNNIRVIDYIRGHTLFSYIPSIAKSHIDYFFQDMPKILWKLHESILAIQLLHENGLCHGDIRNDHIIIDSQTGNYRWIDFDLNQDVVDFDLWSIGNIINYVVGKGIVTFDRVLSDKHISHTITNNLSRYDSSAFYEYRIMNLKKVYPYIPDRLNNILRHFMIRPIDYYENIKQLLHDYREMLEYEFPFHTE